MSKAIKKFIFTIMAFSLIAAGPIWPILAATTDNPPAIRVLPEPDTLLDPDILTVYITVDSPEQSWNVGLLELAYPPEMLLLEQADTSSSSCPLIAYEKSDLAAGRYTLVCGSPEPLTGQTLLARLTFNKLGEGWATLGIGENSLVLAADGHGTSLPVDREYHLVQITK